MILSVSNILALFLCTRGPFVDAYIFRTSLVSRGHLNGILTFRASQKDNIVHGPKNLSKFEKALANPFDLVDHNDDGNEDRDIPYELRMTRKRNKQVLSTFLRFLWFSINQALLYTKYVLISSLVTSTTVIITNTQRAASAISTKLITSFIDFVFFVAKELVRMLASVFIRRDNERKSTMRSQDSN